MRQLPAMIMLIFTIAGCQASPTPDPSSGAPSTTSPASPPAVTPSITPTAEVPPIDPSKQLRVGTATMTLPASAKVEARADGGYLITLEIRGGQASITPGESWQLMLGRVITSEGVLVTAPTVTNDGGGIRRPRWTTQGDQVSVPGDEGATVTFDVGTALVQSHTWESSERILITPTTLARELAPADPVAAASFAPRMMDEIVAADASKAKALGSATAINQLACHLIGARAKDTWNLELDRPDKGLSGFIAARCN